MACRPANARLVNMFHAALIGLECEWYGEWVPSKANIADMMTRPERWAEFMIGLPQAVRLELVLPPIAASVEQLRQWVKGVRG